MTDTDYLAQLVLARAGDLQATAPAGVVGIARRDPDWPQYWVVWLVDLGPRIWWGDEPPWTSLAGWALRRLTPDGKVRWRIPVRAAGAPEEHWLMLLAGEPLKADAARTVPPPWRDRTPKVRPGPAAVGGPLFPAGYQIELCNAGYGGECQLSLVCRRCPTPPVQRRGNWTSAPRPGLTVFEWDNTESQDRRDPVLPLVELLAAATEHEAAAHG